MLQTRARREVASLERGLVVLEIVIGIAPLLGLVGTVYGLITLFGGLSAGGMGDYAVLAKGVSLALTTTLMGLLIAIPALVGWSYYSKKSRRSRWRWKRCATSFCAATTGTRRKQSRCASPSAAAASPRPSSSFR